MFRRRAFAGWLFAGLLCSALPGGAVAQSAPPAGPAGTDWQLVRIAGSGVPFIDLPSGVSATLRIDGTQAGGEGGCNSWFSSVSIDGDTIVFGPIGSTLMACGEPNMSFEGQYLRYLADVQHWTLDGGELQLSDGNGAVLLVFISSAGPVAIEGLHWRADTVLADGVLTAIPAGIDVTLRLSDGQAAGNAGCNSYSGSYTLDGDSLTFGAMAATEMACPEPRMRIESAWLTALGLATGWDVQGGQLHLSDAGGNDLAVLSPYDAATIVGTWALAEIADGPAVGLIESTATVTFAEDGSVTGDTGCNRLQGTYVVDGTGLKVGPVGTTKMACPDPAAASTESALLAALEGASTWSISPEGWLILSGADGTLLAGFTPGTVSVN